MFRVLRRIGVDHKHAIHALVHVAFQRQGMTMVEMAAKWLGIKFIGEFFAWPDQPRPRHTVHARRVNAVEMHGMGV